MSSGWLSLSSKNKTGYMKEYYLKNKANLNAKAKQYRMAHKELIKKQRHNKYAENKESLKAKNQSYYLNNRERIRKQQAIYQVKNRDKIIRLKKDWYQKQGWKSKSEVYLNAKSAVLSLLGGKCVRCGFADLRALQIDHKNGNGHREAKTIGHYGIRNKILQGDINDYQLLCANCNWIKRYENLELGKGKTYRLDKIGE